MDDTRIQYIALCHGQCLCVFVISGTISVSQVAAENDTVNYNQSGRTGFEILIIST